MKRLRRAELRLVYGDRPDPPPPTRGDHRGMPGPRPDLDPRTGIPLIRVPWLDWQRLLHDELGLR